MPAAPRLSSLSTLSEAIPSAGRKSRVPWSQPRLPATTARSTSNGVLTLVRRDMNDLTRSEVRVSSPICARSASVATKAPNCSLRSDLYAKAKPSRTLVVASWAAKRPEREVEPSRAFDVSVMNRIAGSSRWRGRTLSSHLDV